MQINYLDLRQDLSAHDLTHKGLKYTSSILYLYHETGLFQLMGLFRSYTSFTTAIAQRTKIIKLNHLYLYDIQIDHI